MTDNNPDSGTDPVLPTLEEIRDTMYILEGLVEMLDMGTELLDKRSGPLFALIVTAVPLARTIARSLDVYTTRVPS